jgi:hypothetical protein
MPTAGKCACGSLAFGPLPLAIRQESLLRPTASELDHLNLYTWKWFVPFVHIQGAVPEKHLDLLSGERRPAWRRQSQGRLPIDRRNSRRI